MVFAALGGFLADSIFSQSTREGAAQVNPRPGAPEPLKDAFTLVVLPDTQGYTTQAPGTFFSQTRWIAEHAKALNITFVLQVGDVVENNRDEEWTLVRRAFAALDGRVPYAIALGNHDLGPDGQAANRQSPFGRFFPLDQWRKQATFGGVYDREPDRPDNSYHRFSAGGKKWLVLALEFGPRTDVLRWADEIVEKHSDHLVIVVTHAYLDSDGRRFDRRFPEQRYSATKYPLAKDGDVCDGEDIWRKLIEPHANMRLVICGHMGTAVHRIAKGRHGNVVHEMLCDYQYEPNGGNGWLRLMQFLRDGDTVRVTDYSPVLGKVNAYGQASFEFRLSGGERR